MATNDVCDGDCNSIAMDEKNLHVDKIVEAERPLGFSDSDALLKQGFSSDDVSETAKNGLIEENHVGRLLPSNEVAKKLKPLSLDLNKSKLSEKVDEEPTSNVYKTDSDSLKELDSSESDESNYRSPVGTGSFAYKKKLHRTDAIRHNDSNHRDPVKIESTENSEAFSKYSSCKKDQLLSPGQHANGVEPYIRRTHSSDYDDTDDSSCVYITNEGGSANDSTANQNSVKLLNHHVDSIDQEVYDGAIDQLKNKRGKLLLFCQSLQQKCAARL